MGLAGLVDFLAWSDLGGFGVILPGGFGVCGFVWGDFGVWLFAWLFSLVLEAIARRDVVWLISAF